MKTHGFFAMLSRMKYIARWGLMRNVRQENLSEHTLEVAYFAHALALLSGVDPARPVFCALYHDCAEILTGDLPTPVKYDSAAIRDSYKQVERAAAERLLAALPDKLAAAYRPSFFEQDELVLRIVKAADKLSALVKCNEEERSGNRDFESAKRAQLEALRALRLPAAGEFLKTFLPAYELTLDEIELSGASS